MPFWARFFLPAWDAQPALSRWRFKPTAWARTSALTSIGRCALRTAQRRMVPARERLRATLNRFSLAGPSHARAGPSVSCHVGGVYRHHHMMDRQPTVRDVLSFARKHGHVYNITLEKLENGWKINKLFFRRLLTAFTVYGTDFTCSYERIKRKLDCRL